MAYDQTKMSLLTSGSIDGGGNIWRYASPDPIPTVEGAGYIANGGLLGMKPFDLVFVVDTNLGRMYPCFVSAVAVGTDPYSTPGAATIAPGQFA